MNCPPEKRLTRRDAQRLLRARGTGPGTHRSSSPRLEQPDQPEQVERLEHLLAAAAVPSHDDPATRARAVAAFQRLHQAQPAPSTRRTKVTAMKAAVIAALSTKLAAGVAVAAAATGGIALAASTGALSGTNGGHQTHSPAARHSAARSASPSPNMAGLCTAYEAGATSNKGKAAQNPAFTALANAAGGADNINAYCASTLASAHPHPSGKPTDLPTHPTSRPTDVPTHPTGKPSGVPSHPHPAGRPSAVPSHPHPAGRPTAVPSRSHPAGQPTAVPSRSHPAGQPTAVPSRSHPAGQPTAVPSHSRPAGR